MAKPFLITMPKMQFFNNSGTPLSGGQLFIYLPGTTTKQNTYTTSELKTANSNPLVLDSAGRPSTDMYIGAAYKMVVADSTDTDPPANPLWTEDNVTSLAQQITISTKSTNYTVLATDRDVLFLIDSSGGNKTITLLPAATAGAGFTLRFKRIDSGSNTITLQANASELIDAANTATVATSYGSKFLVCDGTQWWIC